MMNRGILATIILSLLAIGGCKLFEPYNQPDLSAPTDFYGQVSPINNNDKSIATTIWKDFFGDTILINLIDEAISNNLDLKLAGLYQDIAELKLHQINANRLPTVGSSPISNRRDYYSKNYNNFGSNRARRNYDQGDIPQSFYKERVEYFSSIDLSWEIDIWGKLKGQRRAQQLRYKQSEEYRKAVQTWIIAELATTYFNLALLKSQIDIYNANLILNTNTLKIVELQFEAGEVTSLAVKQTLSQKLRAQTLIPQLEREFIRQENRLNGLLGRYSKPIVLAELKEPKNNDTYITGQPMELISNRPDIASAELKLKEAYERVGITNAMRYPSINLGLVVGLNSFQLDKLLNPMGSGFLLLNGVIYQPIFQQRKLKTNYEIALKEKEIAEIQFKDSFIQAMNEVSNALVAINKLKEEYIIAQERVTAAKDALEDASFLFRSGLANYLEVITAQREALESELNLESAKMRIFSAEIELYRSLGGGWK